MDFAYFIYIQKDDLYMVPGGTGEGTPYGACTESR
jgi:hypothetical protein